MDSELLVKILEIIVALLSLIAYTVTLFSKRPNVFWRTLLGAIFASLGFSSAMATMTQDLGMITLLGLMIGITGGFIVLGTWAHGKFIDYLIERKEKSNR